MTPQGADDPAILSYGRPYRKAALIPSPANVAVPPPITVATSDKPRRKVASPIATRFQQASVKSPPIEIPQQIPQTAIHLASAQDHGTISATLTGPFEELQLNGEYNGTDDHQETIDDGRDPNAPTAAGSKQKKRQKRALRKEGSPQVVAERTKVPRQKVSPQSKSKAGQPQKKNTGWRGPPFLEEVPQQPKKTLLRPVNGSNSKGQRQPRRKKISDEQNGWATEEATDIQDMGDFDFSGNLSKFDKRSVFDQFKQEDTTADEQRLVTHNRLPPRAGTAGGKNLHCTENVLSPKVNNQAAWASGDSENDLTDAKFGSGRSSNRNASRASARQPPSRKSSVMTSEQHMTGSGSLPESKIRTRRIPRESTDNIKLSRDISSSRDTIKRATTRSETISSRKPSSAQPKPSFRLATSDHTCPCLTPLQMLELEQLAMSELVLTDDMLTENSGRAIAETAIRSADSISYNPTTKDHRTSTIVFLVGNHKTGARAIAGARQALNHSPRIFLTVLGLERDSGLLASVRRQLAIFRKCGGQLLKPDQMAKTLSYVNTMSDLIVDALLGIHINFEDLRTEDQEAYTGLADWANRNASIMAIDMPSGLDPSSGSGNAMDENDLTIYASYVLSLGAPKTELLAAAASGSGMIKNCDHFVADVGISNKVWRKFGTRYKDGVHFGSEWVASLSYHAGNEF